MLRRLVYSLSSASAILLFQLALPLDAFAHGSIVMDDDVCIVEIGFFRAHVTIYQPQTSARKEYCEDVPDTGETLFVLDYLHNSLREMPVDFRIIKDVNNLNRYARWQDIERLTELDDYTVFYQPPVKRADAVFSVGYNFEKAGRYIGIITTKHPTLDKTYNAVFPFQVGTSGFGYLPIVVGLIIMAQIIYWVSNGNIRRRRGKD